MPALEETFGLHGKLVRLQGRSIERSDLIDAEVLLVRSVTQVNAGLLQGTNVAFVGSATIGIDHLDTGWLEANNIAWAHAPGCNADAAAQYTLAMMWLACARLDRDFRQQRVGIIGRGNVGRRLEALLRALDIPVMACDPPLQEQGAPRLVCMREVCANSIISLHVPLTTTGQYPSKHLFDFERLAALRAGTLLVNTSRGGVIEESALLAQLRSGHIHAALDVWPHEPMIEPEFLAAVTVATPHVAGYSHEGKRAGTEMIYQAFRNTFRYGEMAQPAANSDTVTVNFPAAASVDEILRRLLDSSCPVARDDAALRDLTCSPRDPGHIQFDHLRSAYPERHEFKSHLVSGTRGAQAGQLVKMGFKTT